MVTDAILFLLGMLIGAALMRFRYGFTIFFAVCIVLLTYIGDAWFLLCAIMFACELVSAWTGKPWTMVVLRILRPNPIDRMSPAWKAAFERARKRDMRKATGG